MEFTPKTPKAMALIPNFEDRQRAHAEQQAYFDAIEERKQADAQGILELIAHYRSNPSDDLAAEVIERVLRGCEAYDETDEYGDVLTSFAYDLNVAVRQHDLENPDLPIMDTYRVLGAESNADLGDEWDHEAFEETLAQ